MKGRVNIRGKVFRVLIMLFLTFVFALPAGATELRRMKVTLLKCTMTRKKMDGQ